jgi:PAS domain S-box-containing protein
MNPTDEKKSDELRLRAEAERQIDRATGSSGSAGILPASDVAGKMPALPDLLHELQVHQVELEMQNEALRGAQAELEASRDRYLDLYDFAPVGYLTLNSDGMIEELNLTAATLLDMERKDLLHRRFTALVVAEDQSRWMQLILSVMKSGGKSSVEVGLQRRDGTVFQAQLDCEATRVGAGDTAIRIAMIELKRQVNALSSELGRAPPFALDFADAPPTQGLT